MKTSRISVLTLFTLLVFLSILIHAEPLGTAFTYQGQLVDANEPANGLYDLQYRLYDAATEGTVVGSAVNKEDVNVTDGYITVELDFGSVFDGNNRWLEISVRPGDISDPNAYVFLTPRQKITPTPYAMTVAAPLELSAEMDFDQTLIKAVVAGGGTALHGQSDTGRGVFGKHIESGNWGALGGYNIGVEGICHTGNYGYGVLGQAVGTNMYGVYGVNNVNSCRGYLGGEYDGVYGDSYNYYGVHGNSTNGYAGYFVGPKNYFSGNVGIGTPTPTQKLDVTGTVKATSFIGDGSGLTGISFTETDPQVGSNTTNFIPKWDGSALVTGTIFDNGSIGIGTTGPAAKLHVSNSSSSFGMFRIENSNAGDNEATMGFKEGSDAPNSDIWVMGVGGWGNTNDFVVGRSDTKLLVEPSGNVGIGTTSPSQKLEVSGAVKASRTGTDGPHFIIHDSNGSNDRPGIQFTNNYIHYIGGDDGSNEIFGFYSQYGYARNYDAVVNIHGRTSGDWGKHLSLTHDGTNGIISTDSGHLLLSSNQNVGIGTTNPAAQLQVYTNSDVFGFLATNTKANGTVSYGVYGEATGNTTGINVGLYGDASGSSDRNYGVHGIASMPSSGTNYGVYGYAYNSGTGNAYAAFFSGTTILSGNLGIGTTTIPLDRTINVSSGAYLSTGGTWTNSSSRDKKENIEPVDTRQVLEKLVTVPVSTWNYKAEDPATRHIGPMSQDLYAAFELNGNPETISTIDTGGLSFAAIQGLYQIIEEKDAEVKSLKQENEQIKTRLAAIEAALKQLTAGDWQ